MNTLLNTYVIVRGPNLPEELLLGIFGILFLIYVIYKVYLNYRDEINSIPQFIWLLTKIIITTSVICFAIAYISFLFRN
jgi:hypothetical protein